MEEKKETKMSLQEWSMHYRQIIILLVSCLVTLGIYGLANINKNEFPDIVIRQGIVVAVYPGVTAQEIAWDIAEGTAKAGDVITVRMIGRGGFSFRFIKK